MKNVTKKIILITLAILIFNILLFNLNNVAAFSVTDLTGDTSQTGQISNIGNNVITIISTIGSIISVIVLIIIGIKYMIGSVQEKAEYKKTLMPYFIGAVLVFAASTIAGIVYNVVVN